MSNDLNEDSGGGDDWLVGYADMMTLIACFFILMVAFANFDEVGFQIKVEEMSESFRNNSPIANKFFTKSAMHEAVRKKPVQSMKNSQMHIAFTGSALFKNGEYDLDAETKATVDALIDILKSNNPHYRIMIEGHADDLFSQDMEIQTNWRLSSLRAASVIERFEYFGFAVQNLIAISKGDTSKIIESIDQSGKYIEANAKINRRVEIRVLEPKEKKKVKLGLGIYFQDATENINEGVLQKGGGGEAKDQ
jgi:chemotaxis protein MotB